MAFNRSGPDGAEGTLCGGRESGGESVGGSVHRHPWRRRARGGSVVCTWRRGLLEGCSAGDTRVSPSRLACSRLLWTSQKSGGLVGPEIVASVQSGEMLTPPRRCRTWPARPSRGSSGASSGRMGGCTSCRILELCTCTACPWCARACASFGRSSWQTGGHSPRSRTQTVFRLEIRKVNGW